MDGEEQIYRIEKIKEKARKKLFNKREKGKGNNDNTILTVEER